MTSDHEAYRADMAHYWARLMWYRDELWRITTPVWAVYGAFIASCVGYVWSSEKSGRMTVSLAIMMTLVIATFTWVMLRLYKIYSGRIYEAISGLNSEVQKREQLIYDLFLNKSLEQGKQLESDYTRFRVYPRLHLIFSIVAIAMACVCTFTVWASVDLVQKSARASPPGITSTTCAASTYAAVSALPAPATACPPVFGVTEVEAPVWVALAACLLLLAVFEGAILVFRWRDEHLDGRCPKCPP